MIKTIIIDDDQDCIDAILDLIKLYPNNFDVIGAYTSVEKGVLATKSLSPDLVFLDVEINGKTGFDYLIQVRNVDFKVVFTTAYSKYAVKAFKFSALDYLLKPIDSDDFEEAVRKIKREEYSKTLSEKIDNVIHNLTLKDHEKRIIIGTKTSSTIVSVHEILYCEAWVNYTNVYTLKEGKITSTKTLKYYDNLLEDSDFYRIDQSYLVNMKYVKKYTKGKPAYAILTNGTKLKVSLKNKQGFLEQLNSMFRS